MVKLDKIVTRGGDHGETSLGDGERIRKDAARINALGALDEANASLGILRLHTHDQPDIDACLADLQNDLFDLGADIAVPGEMGERLRITDAYLAGLDEMIERLNAHLPALRSFVLPGGTQSAAYAHLARTIIRRAERDLVALHAATPINPNLVRYLNRASDVLFIIARTLNDLGRADILWRPGGARQSPSAPAT